MFCKYLLETKWTDEWMVYLTGGLVLFTAVLAGITLFIALKANEWTHKYWRKQKREDIIYQSKLEAAKAAWGLLIFLTEKENGKNFLIYQGTKESPEIFFDLIRGRNYLTVIAKIFFEDGHGVFLSKEIKQYIFHVRSNVYRILDREERAGKTSGKVLLENPGVVEFFRKSFENLRKKIVDYSKKDLHLLIEESEN